MLIIYMKNLYRSKSMHARNGGINYLLSHLNGTPIQYKFLTNRVFSLALLFYFLAQIIIHLTDKTLTCCIDKISCSVTERSETICIMICSFQNNINAKKVCKNEYESNFRNKMLHLATLTNFRAC